MTFSKDNALRKGRKWRDVCVSWVLRLEHMLSWMLSWSSSTELPPASFSFLFFKKQVSRILVFIFLGFYSGSESSRPRLRGPKPGTMEPKITRGRCHSFVAPPGTSNNRIH